MTPEDGELLSAGYVLGTLGGAERAAFECRLAGDEDLQVLVAGWERRLAGLEDGQPGIAPPARLWAAIEQSLAAALQAAAGAPAGAKVLRDVDRTW